MLGHILVTDLERRPMRELIDGGIIPELAGIGLIRLAAAADRFAHELDAARAFLNRLED